MTEVTPTAVLDDEGHEKPRTEAEARKPCDVRFLGLAPYRPTWDLQSRLGQLRGEDRIPDTLLLLEHPHTYTMGRRADPSNLLLSRTQLEDLGAEVLDIDRGGDVTYHGPGQLVGYPIMLVEDRRELVKYVRRLEATLIGALAEFGIPGERVEGLSGVWVRGRKIAAIGVKMGRVTSHGFALNVSTDLCYFGHIIPCGIRDKGVTSMEEELRSDGSSIGDEGDANAAPSVLEVAHVVARHFGEVFDRMVLEA